MRTFLTKFSFMTPDWCWELLYDPFAKHGDAFLTVSPGSVLGFISNAEAIHQITSRRDAFPKPLASYRILEIFGRNIITTEGIQWREHRKISSPSFTEKNNALVFAESCIQAQGMLRKWLGPEGRGDVTLKEVPTDTMRITLHIISRIGFGVRLLWPGEKPRSKEQESVYSSNEAPEGHTMSFERSLSTLLETLVWVLFLPKWLLSTCRQNQFILIITNRSRIDAFRFRPRSIRIFRELGSVYERAVCHKG